MAITIFLFGAVLKITSSVVLPFTISVLLAIVMSPLVKFLAKFRIPRIISVLLVLILLASAMGATIMILYSSGHTMVNLYPKYEARLKEIYIYIARFFELPYDEHLSFFDNLWGQVGIRSRIRVLTISFSNAFLAFLRDAFMVALFMAFILFEAAFFREKLEKAFEGTRAAKIIKITSDLMTQVTRYLSIKFVISVVNGILVGIGLKIIGLEFAAVWGVIQFIVNFIPTLGSIAVGLAATAFAVIQFWPQPGPIIATALVMLIINLILGSVMAPKIMGDRLGLSPLIIILSLLAWGWIWGFAGMILAVPMTAIIKIVCENIPVLEPISILIGSRKGVMAHRNPESSCE
jgi:predicted PurR-regulated permease PerM